MASDDFRLSIVVDAAGPGLVGAGAILLGR
jgi:hypothetical protein